MRIMEFQKEKRNYWTSEKFLRYVLDKEKIILQVLRNKKAREYEMHRNILNL